MSRSLRFLAALVLFVLPVFAGCGAAKPSAPPSSAAPPPTAPPAAATATAPVPAPIAPIKVAMLTPVTGPFAVIGTSSRAGAEMAVAEIDAAAAADAAKVELEVIDVGDTNTTALAALEKALSKNPAALLIMTTSGQTLAMTQTLAKEAVPALAAAPVPMVFAGNIKYLFSLLPTDDIAAAGAVDYATQKLGKKKVGMLTTGDQVGQFMAGIVKAQAEKRGAEYVAEFHEATDKDLTPQLLNLRSKGIDVLIGWATPPTGALLVKQMKQLGLDLPLFLNVGANGALLNLVEADEIAGVYSPTSVAPSLATSPSEKAWYEAWKGRVNLEPDPSSTHSYDAIKILSHVAAQAGSDPEKLRDALANLKGFPGISGEFSYDDKRFGRHDVLIVQVQADKSLKLLERVGKGN